MARHLGYPARVVMGFAPEVREDAQARRGGRRRRDRVGRGAVRGCRMGARSARRPTRSTCRRSRRRSRSPSRSRRCVSRRARSTTRSSCSPASRSTTPTTTATGRSCCPAGCGSRSAPSASRGARASCRCSSSRLVKGVAPPPAPQRRERPPGGGRLGGARRPLRRARVRAAGDGHAAAVRPCARAAGGRAGPRRGRPRRSPRRGGAGRLSTLAATIDRDVFAGGEVSDAVVEDRWTDRGCRDRGRRPSAGRCAGSGRTARVP